MELGSHLVGSGLKEYRKEVGWRETMNYAAATDDDNPVYFDDGRKEGIIAPPMFCVAVTWPVTEKLEEFIGHGLLTAEISATKVHYTEHIEFYRPVRPGGLKRSVLFKVSLFLADTSILIRSLQQN